MNTFLKVLLIVIAVVYVVSPIDLLPGPIDDIIVIILTYLGEKKLTISDQSAAQ